MKNAISWVEIPTIDRAVVTDTRLNYVDAIRRADLGIRFGDIAAADKRIGAPLTFTGSGIAYDAPFTLRGALTTPDESIAGGRVGLTLHAEAAQTSLDATRHLLGKAQLAQMKPGAFLINISRADIVERHALHDALASGRLGGLGLDTFYEEPGRADDPLLRFKNVIITQRIAAQPRMNAFGDLAELMAGLASALGERI